MNATHLAELYDLLRIPSVSADPNHADDVRRAGEWVRDLVRSAKGGEAELVETDAQPMVIPVDAAPCGQVRPFIDFLVERFASQPEGDLKL